MKKVLFVIDSLNCGGAEKSITSLLPLLDSSKYDIDLLVMSGGGLFEEYLPQNINLHYFRDLFPLSMKERILQKLYSIKLRVFNNTHPAEIHWSTFQNCYGSLKKKYDVAIAYQQGFPSYFVSEKVNASKKIAWVNADIKKAGYNAKFNTPFYNQFDTAVAVSENLKKIVAEYASADKIKIIYDIVNPDQIRALAQKQCTFPKSLNITTVARLAPPKGYDLAIEAAEILKNKGIDFIWHFVGDGPSRKEIEQQIVEKKLTKHIIIEGLQPNPYPYIKNADIYVQPSKFEGFGITIAEAKILHKPIVSTNFPVVYNQLTNDKNALIVNMSGQDIANGILRIIKEPILAQRLSEELSTEQNRTHLTEAQKVMDLIDNI